MNRRLDGLKLFRPTEQQEKFFTCKAHKILVTGGQRSGKTVAAAVRFAAFMRDMPVTLRSGKQISYRRPRDQNGHVICWIIGYNWSHLVDTIKKKLFEPGLYSIIRDPQTKEWRCVDPDNHYDVEHQEMWRDAPPLIPAHEMEMSEFSWRLMRCTAEMTKNRGTIRGIPSSGDLTTGDAVTCIWIDEHIEIPEYFGDWQTRLASTEGYLFWSAFDNMWANDAFLNLYDECERETVKDDPLAVRFALRQRDNPHISKRGTEIAMSGLSEDERAARDEGIHQIDKILMYPWFSETHHVIKKSTPTENDAVAKILIDNHMRPPADWTKYLVLDPGTLHPALLAVAVPPPQIGPFAVAFQEIFPGRMDAEGLAAMAAKTFDWCWFEAFIIDNQAGQKTPEGFSQTIYRRYADMFQKYNLLSRQTGASFWIGSRDIPARTQAVTSMLVPCYPSGKPRIRIVEHACPHLIDQLKRYRRHVDKATRIVSEKPAERQTIDLAVCLEYFAARDPKWYPQPDLPPNASPVQTMIYRRIKELEAERAAGQTVFHCGPGMIS